MSDLFHIVNEMKPALMGVGAGAITVSSLHGVFSVVRGFQPGTTVTDEFKKSTPLQTIWVYGLGTLVGALYATSNVAYSLDTVHTSIRTIGAAALAATMTGVGKSLYRAATTPSGPMDSFKANFISADSVKGGLAGAVAYVALDYMSRM